MTVVAEFAKIRVFPKSGDFGQSGLILQRSSKTLSIFKRSKRKNN
jgi:hypothetical protein